MKTWVNFHTHGKFSFLDGYGRYEQYFDRCKELGMPALGITEHGNLHSWPDFYDLAKAADIKPILGMEAYQARKTRFDQDEEERAGRASDEWEQRGPHHLTLLAQNMTGYKNIIKISSRAYLEGFYGKPRMDFEILQDHSEGVIVLSGCLSGKIQQAILRGDLAEAENYARTYQQIVGKDNFYIEIMNHFIPEEEQVFDHLVDLANKIGAKLIPTNDCHYVHKEDAHNHDLMLCVSTGARVTDEERFRFFNDSFYLKSHDEMSESFPEDWLKNTLDLADRVQLELEFDKLYYPEYPLGPEQNIDDVLEEKVRTGINLRYGDRANDTDVQTQLNHELGVIKRMGYQHYFLVVSDITDWARLQGIRTGWGRGSGSGSIVSYGLGITGLDPLEFELLFERFLVEGRISPPDIDLDFNDKRRDEVIDYIHSKYGSDRVCYIGTFTEIGARSAVRDAARVLDYEYQVGDKIAKLVPAPVLGVSPSLEEAMNNPLMREECDKNPDAKKILDAAFGLEGLIRQSGVHPAGILVTPGPVIDYVPVMQKGPDEPIVTQWDMRVVERNGLLKIDCLGLRNLRVIDDCVNLVKQSRNLDLDIYNLSLNDTASYNTLREGNTMGIFQLESSNMRQMVMSVQPSTINDIMAILSLYRPGPMGAGMDKEYVARKNGRKAVQYVHPALQDILNDNYGIMLYQEDVINVAKKFAGMNTLEADALRKDIGKKLMDKIHKHRNRFVSGAKQVSKASDVVANKIYSDIEYFGGYGFNKCLTGDTRIAQYMGGTNVYWRDYKEWNIEDLYRKIHWRFVSDRFFPGPCLVCAKRVVLYRNSMCPQCDLWRTRFLKNGMKILAYNPDTNQYENAKLKDVICNGMQDVYRISLDNGRHLDATIDHKSLTTEGWKRTGQLTTNDYLISINEDMETVKVGICDIEFIGQQLTYDIEMDSDHHNFVANSVVTHNSHAASYAIVSYVTAYLKTHYPAEYMAALLSSVEDSQDKAARYISECRRLGISVLPPSMNESDTIFKVISDHEILFGFGSIAGIGPTMGERLVAERKKSNNLFEFFRNSPSDILNKKTVESLAFSGALDEMVPEQSDRVLRRSTKDNIALMEKQYLGLYITEHPLTSSWHILRSHVDMEIADIDQTHENKRITIAGVITSANKRLTKTGRTMYEFSIEDLSGAVGVVAWSRKGIDIENLAIAGNIVFVEAIVAFGGEEISIPQLKLQGIRKAELPDWEAGEAIMLYSKLNNSDVIDAISNIIEENPGDSPVYIKVPIKDNGEPSMMIRFKKPTSLKVKQTLIDLLERN